MTTAIFDSTTKDALRKTIRGLRARLLDQLTVAAEGEYRLSLPLDKAKLPQGRRIRRQRLEDWLNESTRAELRGVGDDGGKAKGKAKRAPSGGDAVAVRARLLNQAVKEAAYTLLNRVVLVRIMEHHGLSKPAVVTGGWQSQGYREFAQYAQALTGDDVLGYDLVLGLVFDELALELPGLFGPVGLAPLFPIPAATWRDVLESVNDAALEAAWGEDTTLGWIYQFWNDPERESLDDKIADGGKVQPHEIASKTQMFTERYMVEWLLQNSLGTMWLQICAKQGWVADFESVRGALEERRAEWRGKRERGEVALDALMPLHGPLEDQWKYWVAQPVPAPDENTPGSVRDLKLLDPACGSGHFLVIAFDLLAALYAEEARHRGQVGWDAEDVAQSIVQNNLHGVDIDPRAVQIAAAALWLKAKRFAPGVRLERMNLVAPAFKLAALAADDPARVRLQADLEAQAGIPKVLTETLLSALAGVDHLGTLLRVDRDVENALMAYQAATKGASTQGSLFTGMPAQQLKLPVKEVKEGVLDKLGAFLDAHQAEQDLGLRLEGEQLAAGVRFVKLVREGAYDVVVGNPPYQGTSKMEEVDWFKKHYPRGKADLYACFLERGLELVREGGVSALLTMRGWMFLSTFTELREGLLGEFDLRCIGDFDRGAFDDVPNEVLSVACCVFQKGEPAALSASALQPTPSDDKSYDRERTKRKRAAVLAHVGHYTFDAKKLAGIEGTPLVYWWDNKFLDEYIAAPKLGDVARVRSGMQTADNTRFLRAPWEAAARSIAYVRCSSAWQPPIPLAWVPYIQGGKGHVWVEPLKTIIDWSAANLGVLTLAEHRVGATVRNPDFFFVPGVAFTPTGSDFAGRAHRFRSVCDTKGASVFPDDVASITCLLNSSRSRQILTSFNPSISFQVGDVERLSILPYEFSGTIFGRIDSSFAIHEAHREPSVEFRSPGPSPWRSAQSWAQLAVDRGNGAPLPEYVPELDPPDREANLSFAIGVALGRFGANGEGILNEAPATALPHGMLFLSASDTIANSLTSPPPNATAAIDQIKAAWQSDSSAILKDTKRIELSEYLRREFFKYHKNLYENRPIYFPLSSANRSFVAWVSIHRFNEDTLPTLLSDHLHPVMRQLTGEINDINRNRASSDKKTQSAAEKQYAQTKTLLDELQSFIATVTQITEKGAPPTDPKCPARDVDARFQMDLDDGVMINSAALWPLLAPQWKDPAKWWKELCLAQGRQDYDWSHMAARYFPQRVDQKCRQDPSLAVAHKCFWQYHPARAYAWELRLQQEIDNSFTIDEPGSDEHRKKFLAEHADEARAIEEREHHRRERVLNRKDSAGETEPDDAQSS